MVPKVVVVKKVLDILVFSTVFLEVVRILVLELVSFELLEFRLVLFVGEGAVLVGRVQVLWGSEVMEGGRFIVVFFGVFKVVIVVAEVLLELELWLDEFFLIMSTLKQFLESQAIEWQVL